MAWQDRIRRWFPRIHRSAVHADLGEELMFHFRALVNERIAEGRSFDDAWSQAEERFGPMHCYMEECRLLGNSSRVRARRRIVLASTLLLLGGGAWQFNRVITLESALADARIAQQRAREQRQEERASQSPLAPGETSPRVALSGTIMDRECHPVADATVLVILKTWPRGRYRQVAFHCATEPDGRFCIDDILPSRDRHGVLVAAFKDGYAFRSSYQLKENAPADAVDLVLDKAAAVTLIIQDEKGLPIAGSRVVPSARQSADGQTNLVYFMGSEPIQALSDSAGRIPLSCFSAGDHAEVYLQLPGKDWESRRVHIPAEGAILRMASSPSSSPIQNLSQK